MTTTLLTLFKRSFTMPWAALAIVAAGLVALVSAYVLEHFFGVFPCILCLFQRVPFVVTIVLALGALVFRNRPKMVGILLGLCALAYFVDTGIAFFHSGVELHWWAGTDGCSVAPAIAPDDPAAARMALLETAVAQCDEITFTFLGFSLANWNILITFALGVFAALAACRSRIKWLS